MSDLANFLRARVDEPRTPAMHTAAGARFALDYAVMMGGLINLHDDAAHECPGRDYDGHRIADYEQDCPTLMLAAYPYRSHPDWKGEWKA